MLPFMFYINTKENTPCICVPNRCSLSKQVRKKNKAIGAGAHFSSHCNELVHCIFQVIWILKITKLFCKPLENNTTTICRPARHITFFSEQIIEKPLFFIIQYISTDHTDSSAVFNCDCCLMPIHYARTKGCKASIT